jgi:hypothetical protein
MAMAMDDHILDKRKMERRKKGLSKRVFGDRGEVGDRLVVEGEEGGAGVEVARLPRANVGRGWVVWIGSWTARGLASKRVNQNQ